MTNTEKVLEAYCKKFGLCKEKGTCQCKKELRFIAESIHQAEQSLNDTIKEKVADERDKAEKHYEEDQDDYSQGYYMAMNTVIKYLDSLQDITK